MSDILFKKTYKKEVQTVEDFVTKKFDLKQGELYAPNRKQEIVNARFVAYYLLNTVYALNFPQIGEIFNKDHTTVIHGIQKIKNEGWIDEIDRQFLEVIPSIHTPNSSKEEI